MPQNESSPPGADSVQPSVSVFQPESKTDCKNPKIWPLIDWHSERALGSPVGLGSVGFLPGGRLCPQSVL